MRRFGCDTGTAICEEPRAFCTGGEISRTMHGEIKMHAERKEDGIWRSCRAARVRACVRI